MHRLDCNFIELIINNGGIMQLAQYERDEDIILTTYNEKSGLIDTEIKIDPGELVMLMNYYRFQKENNKPIF